MLPFQVHRRMYEAPHVQYFMRAYPHSMRIERDGFFYSQKLKGGADNSGVILLRGRFGSIVITSHFRHWDARGQKLGVNGSYLGVNGWYPGVNGWYLEVLTSCRGSNLGDGGIFTANK